MIDKNLLVRDRAFGDQKNIFYILDTIPEIKKVRNVLDVGCGSGGSSEILKLYSNDFLITAIDNNKECIEQAITFNKKDINYVWADAINMPFEDKVFDMVFVRMVFEVTIHVEDIIKEIKRVCKKNGYIIVYGNLDTVPRIYPEPKYYYKYRLAEERLLQKTRESLYNPLQLTSILKKYKFVNIKFETISKNTTNTSNEELRQYYIPDCLLEENLLIKTGLMKNMELQEYMSSYSEMLNCDDSFVLYLQYYIIGKVS